MPEYLESWVEDKARQRLVREISYIESEWPAHTGSAEVSGFIANIDVDSCSLLLSIPSSKWFKPRLLWLTNNNTAPNKLFMYTGGSNPGDVTATIGEIYIGARETAFIALDCVTMGGDVHVSCLIASLGVRIGGVLVQSGPEN